VRRTRARKRSLALDLQVTVAEVDEQPRRFQITSVAKSVARTTLTTRTSHRDESRLAIDSSFLLRICIREVHFPSLLNHLAEELRNSFLICCPFLSQQYFILHLNISLQPYKKWVLDTTEKGPVVVLATGSPLKNHAH
jgi:hypothetical protein